MITPECDKPLISYTCAYWDYLRRKTSHKPLPVDHGLDEDMARVLRIQCDIEFKSQQGKLPE